jgi:hypothetical protein
MSDEPIISGPEVPADPVAALNAQPRRKKVVRHRRGAQRVQGPTSKRDPESETHTVVGVNVVEGLPVAVSTTTTGPRGYVPLGITEPIKSPFDVVTGEIVLLMGRAECEVLGLTANGRVRLKTVDPALMGNADEMCADAGQIVKKAGSK